MSAVSALLTAAAPSAQTTGTGNAVDATGVAGATAGAEAQSGNLTLMFQQLLAAALDQQPQAGTTAATASQLPAVLESLTAQLTCANGGRSGAAGSAKAVALKDADPTDVAAVAAALLAALQFSNGTPPPAPGGAGATASETADAAVGSAPALTAALAQLLSAGTDTAAGTAKPGAAVTALPIGSDAGVVAGAVDLQSKPVGDPSVPQFMEALKAPDDLLRGASADASPTQHVVEKLGTTTAVIIPQNAGDGRAPSAAPVVERTITVPMQHPAWTEHVASQVAWCVDQGVQSARLQITPEHLGPVEIKLELADGKVNVNFGASQAETRAMLEQSIPRLRELMSGAGLSLGEATVQQQMRQQSQNPSTQTVASDAVGVDDGFVPLHRVLGLVDEYA